MTTTQVTVILSDLAHTLRHHRHALLVFYLSFAVLAMGVLLPLATAPLSLVEHVSNRSAISTGGLLAFINSAGGVLWILATVTVTVLMATLQQAGMTLIPAGGTRAPYFKALVALWGMLRRLPALLSLTVLQAGAYVLVAAPFLLIAGITYELLIAPHDEYYLRIARPVELWLSLAIGLVAAGGLVVSCGWLFMRWVLAVPVMMLEGAGPRQSLRRSGELVRGRARPLVGIMLITASCMFIVPLLFSALFSDVGGRILAGLPDRVDVVVPAVLIYLTTYIVLGVAIAFLGIAIHSLLAYTVYRRAVQQDPRIEVHEPPRRAGPIAWLAELLLVLAALFQAASVLGSLDTTDQVTVIAHRGSSAHAPENTMSAIERAIADGADYVELDLRRTADGVPVLWHDAMLMRIGEIRRYVSDVTLEEMQEIDVGGWFAPEFAGERIATLAEVLDRVCGRIGLYLEIKPAVDAAELTRDTLQILDHADCLDGVVVISSNPRILAQAKALQPEISTTLLAQFVLGSLSDDAFDALALRANRATPRAVAAARRNGYEIHVWTVNDRAAMARLLDMGVDGIITDYPDVLVNLLDERSRLTDTERLLVKIRSWLSS
jgi:glycerophosphoryl diester phosphodiesterase